MRSFDTVVHIGTRWLRFVWQGSTLLGVVMIGLVWTSLSFHLELERNNSERAAIQNSSNLARAFEGHLFRSLIDIDRSLKVVRANYVLHPEGFELGEWMHRSGLFDDQILQLSIIGPDGFLKLSTIDAPSPGRIDLSDREHFRIHVNAKTDDLFISKPVIGRKSGKWSIQLTRRIEHTDGSFGGVIVASVDPNYFARFYSSIDIGNDGHIKIVGADGVIRAVGGRTPEPIGGDLSGTTLFKRYPRDSAGWFYTSSDLSDSIPQLLTYRAVKGYPLVITIGVSSNEIFSGVYAKRRAYNSIAMALTVLILVITGFSVRGRLTLDRMSEELHTQNLRFDMALRNMSQGVCMFDAKRRLVVCNDRYAKMYQLPPELLKVGTPHNAIIAHRVLHGLLKGEKSDATVQQKISTLSALPADARSSRIDELADGRLICVTREPMEGGGWVATHEDITERRRAELERDRNRALLDLVVESVPATIVLKDARDFRYVLINRAGEQYYGIAREKMIGKTAHDILPKAAADLVTVLDRRVLEADQKTIVDEHYLETPGHGTRIAVSTRLPILDDKGEPQYLLAVVEDVTERRQAEARIAHMAQHDALTELPNRAAFNDRLAFTIDRATKSGESFAILCVDLDRFKEVNDEFGHSIGDGLLREVARRLQSAADGAFVARLGGDEFILISAEGPQPLTAASLANRLIAAVADEIEVENQRLHIGLSVGIAIYPTDGEDVISLIGNADAALYQSKAEGVGTTRFFEAEMDVRLRERRALQHDLRLAVERGELAIHYQPQAQIAGDIVGFEALIRWRHSSRGMVAPATFIPIAEETGLINPIGEWVLREACREAASWTRPLRIAINLSSVQFRHGDLANLVHSVLLESGLAPDRLELEITESVLISDFSRALSILRRLKTLGVRIAMDDFGTGYSSLSYLQAFPFDRIKIDRAFISNLATNPQSAAIVRAVIGLGHGLDIPVTAEGVENEDQLEFLLREACDEVQGYLLGRPCPIEDYAELIGRVRRPEAIVVVGG